MSGNHGFNVAKLNAIQCHQSVERIVGWNRLGFNRHIVNFTAQVKNSLNNERQFTYWFEGYKDGWNRFVDILVNDRVLYSFGRTIASQTEKF